jgi:urease accessory protein
VGARAVLVLAPDPTACFAGARFRQRTEVELTDGASVALWDVLSAGRSARGERWALARCVLGMSLRRDGTPVLDESWLLDPAHGALRDRLGRFEALATVLLAGPLFARAREAVQDGLSQPPERRARVVGCASALAEDVVVARFAAASVEELSHALRARLAPVTDVLGDDPWARRA